MKWHESLIATAKPFIDDFKPHFMRYSISLLPIGAHRIDESEFIKAMEDLYDSFLDPNGNLPQLKDNIHRALHRDTLLTNYITNRSLLFLLSQFNDASQSNHPNLHVCLSEMVSLILHFIKEFDDALPEISKLSNTDVVFNNESSFDAHRTISDTFLHIKNCGEKIRFMNLYKGVPISYEAEVVSVNDDEVSFKTDALQELAMKLDGKAYIVKNDYFDKHIKADIMYSNFATSTVTLNNFIYMLNMPAAQREFIRVPPNTLAKVTLQNSQEKETSGNLYDLSYNGLGVISEENFGIKEGDEVDISFNLPVGFENSIHPVHVKGEVVTIIEYHNAYRYCTKIHPDVPTQRVIMDYVNEREEEIHDSLKEQLKEYIG